MKAVWFAAPAPPPSAAVITFTSLPPAKTVTSVESRGTNGISLSSRLP